MQDFRSSTNVIRLKVLELTSPRAPFPSDGINGGELFLIDC
jgi:hypothetical protein